MSEQQQSTTELQVIQVPAGQQRHVARVKWFDNKLNFGFATIVTGEHATKDIFVHQSHVLTLAQGVYRTLRQGEYIEFALEENPEGSQHKYQAISVTGPYAGPLMCETNPRRPRPNNNQRSTSAESTQQQRQHRGPRQSRGPRQTNGPASA